MDYLGGGAKGYVGHPSKIIEDPPLPCLSLPTPIYLAPAPFESDNKDNNKILKMLPALSIILEWACGKQTIYLFLCLYFALFYASVYSLLLRRVIPFKMFLTGSNEMRYYIMCIIRSFAFHFLDF